MTRDIAIEVLTDLQEGSASKFWYGENITEALNMAIEALEQEPIIHCKDCKYWQDNNNGYPHKDCRWNEDETPDADDFCSFAERKEQ